MSSTTPIRIVQVSDTHVSARRAYFLDNWDVFVDLMRADPPDLIVHSGDVSFDGAGDVDGGGDDLAFATREKSRLPQPWVAIPGNHDIGESVISVRHNQPTNAARRAAWEKAFGPTRWRRDVGEWRLIGIDTALMGCGNADEMAQRAFLEQELAGRGGRPVLLFQHMPPYLDDPDDTKPTSLAVPHVARRWLLDTCATGGVAAIACGHVHVYRHVQYREMDIIWAPATSFFNIAERQKAGFGSPRAGYVEWTLAGRNVSHRVVEPPLMITHDIGAWNAAHGSTTKMPPRPLHRERRA